MNKLISLTGCFLLICTPLIAQCISGDCENGMGIYKWETGAQYEGEWQAGKKDGQGTYSYGNGDKYVGTWENDNETGRGILYMANGDRYEGSFLAGSKNGKGTYYYLGGDRFEGNFVNDVKQGKGTYYHSNGDRFEGNYVNGNHEGKGTYYHSSGDRYEGNFLDEQFHGQGVYFFANADRYEGNFAKGEFEGEGKLYYAAGGILIGIWKDGKYISAGNKDTNQKKEEQSGNIDMIAMTKAESGIYEIPIMINNALKLHFIIDTGASELILSPDVVLTLIRTKTVTENDFLEGKEFILADGTTMQSSRFNIREITIGNHTIRNVAAAISNSIEAPILLGQNVLSKLGRIQIDYTQGTFTIID